MDLKYFSFVSKAGAFTKVTAGRIGATQRILGKTVLILPLSTSSSKLTQICASESLSDQIALAAWPSNKP